jgi:hypothetical protein
MKITFRDDSSLGRGSFIRVLRGDRNFGFIQQTSGTHRFYVGDGKKLGGPDFEGADLEQLKAGIEQTYGGDR